MIQYPSYHIDNLKERYNESLLKKIELSMKEYSSALKKLNLSYIKHSLPIAAYRN